MDSAPTRGSATARVHAALLEPLDISAGRIEGRCDQLQQGYETTLANLNAALEGR